jgi:hypothetical protein
MRMRVRTMPGLLGLRGGDTWLVIGFRFVLRPVGEITPWGGRDPMLHWFGLTDGWYWIELDDRDLLRYSQESLRGSRGGGHDVARSCVDYQVVRLWEDLIQMTPAVLEPVPADLASFVASHPASWAPCGTGEAGTGEAGTGEADTAAQWHADHTLDLLYLRAPPWIQWWRTVAGGKDVVTMRWLHRPEAGIEFTAGRQGQVTVATSAFIAAVEEFDRGLLTAMEARVTGLERTGPPRGVRIDMHRLRTEQQDRAQWLQRALRHAPGTDWSRVRMGAAELLAT